MVRKRDCELCGQKEDCRPYGPNKEYVCFPCGMKDKSAATKHCRARLKSESSPSVQIAYGILRGESE